MVTRTKSEEDIRMATSKTTKFEIELNDGIGIADGLDIVREALREIDTKLECGDGYLEWDISKNVPGYSVKMRDDGIGYPHRFIVGKAPRIRKAAPKDKTAC